MTVVTKKNLGKSLDIALPILPKCMITTPKDFFISTANQATEALMKAAFQALLVNPINSRGYLWPQFASQENISTESKYEDNELGIWPTSDGQYRFKFGIRKGVALHKAMYTHRAIDEGRVFIVDIDNNIWGTFDSAGKLFGFTMGMLHTEKLLLGDGSVSTKSPIIVTLSDHEEIDINLALVDFGSILNTLERLTDVTLTLPMAAAAAVIVVDVKRTIDSIPISGLLAADFVLYASDGVTLQTLGVSTPDANIAGRYSIAQPVGNAFEDGTLTLRAASLLTVQAYECPLAIAIDV